MKKSILLITRDFTPYCKHTGWMIRAVSLANFIKKNEFHVNVLATKRSSEVNELHLEDGINTYWVKNGLHHALSTSLKLFHVSVIPYLFKYLFTKFKDKYIYDYDHPLISDYKTKISEIIEKRGISRIIISTPPHSLLLLIPWIKSRYPSVAVIMDMRDAWSFRPMYRSKGEKQSFIEWHEAEIIKHADACVYVTEGLAELYLNKYGNHHAVVIENGFTETRLTSPPREDFLSVSKKLKKQNKLIIGYFGSGSIGFQGKHKELSPLIEVINNDEELQRRIHLIVQGTIKVKSKTNIPSFVTILPSAQHSVIHSHMSLIDIGLSLFNDPPYHAGAVIVAKTYDYIRAGIPILGVSDPRSSSIMKKINEVGGMHSDINSPGSMRDQLYFILKEYDRYQSLSHLVKIQDKNKFNRSIINKKYLTVLDEIA